MKALGGLTVLWLLALTGCPEDRKVEEERRVRTTAQVMGEGRAELAKNKPERAVLKFKEAISMSPGDVDPYLQLAEAYRLAGNEPGAVLTLKQAEEVAGGNDPSLKRARADMLLKLNQYRPAIAEFLVLRNMEILTDDELRMVALLLAHDGQVREAYATINRILNRLPDDPTTKTVEAEILLIESTLPESDAKTEPDGGTDKPATAKERRANLELLSTTLMDKLIEQNPDLTPARVLRARYFRANGQLEAAEADLLAVKESDKRAPEVVTLRSRVLNELRRHDEAAQLVEPLLEEDPKNPALLSLLAQTRLRQDRGADAQVLIDRALGENAKFAPALSVRGESYEQGGNLESAIADYETALRSDPTYTPPLSRLWPLYLKQKRTGEAMTTLERLLFMGEATPQEKVEVARLYVASNTDFKRARVLVADALRRNPKDAELIKLKAKIDKALAPRNPGIIIMKHR